MFHSFCFFFSSIAKSFSIFSFSFIFTQWSTEIVKSTLVNEHKVWFSDRDWLKCLYCNHCNYYFTPLEFFISLLADSFHWSLSDSKSTQISRTLLSILALLSNAVIWIVSTRPSTSKSSSPFNNPLVSVPKAPITIGTIFTFMFHSFFNSLPRSRYLSFFSHSFSFILWSARTAKYYYYYYYYYLQVFLTSEVSLESESQQVLSPKSTGNVVNNANITWIMMN